MASPGRASGRRSLDRRYCARSRRRHAAVVRFQQAGVAGTGRARTRPARLTWPSARTSSSSNSSTKRHSGGEVGEDRWEPFTPETKLRHRAGREGGRPSERGGDVSGQIVEHRDRTRQPCPGDRRSRPAGGSSLRKSFDEVLEDRRLADSPLPVEYHAPGSSARRAHGLTALQHVLAANEGGAAADGVPGHVRVPAARQAGPGPLCDRAAALGAVPRPRNHGAEHTPDSTYRASTKGGGSFAPARSALRRCLSEAGMPARC